ncbi:hypothetical protein PENSOL_c005G02676 [Penicillium solitum]|uniref:Uncharacterized protein n=1 Tax=Penicillium solitum TaxID=60172 RepID=A0A1V6RGV0_9EURO|nr:uncharacterized protein PENSOL_c005G02676 [Penicillium solitum]OQE01031.1 hypothetical protein PENSOL_c005G02676 [Penicillium solitum]
MPTTEELKHVDFNAERDLNSHQAKQGRSRKSDSTVESGVDEMVDQRFSQPTSVKYGSGSTASGSDHRVILDERVVFVMTVTDSLGQISSKVLAARETDVKI